MGDEIAKTYFSKNDFSVFQETLRRETELFHKCVAEGMFSEGHGVGGFELEAWLVDGSCDPAPINTHYLKVLDDPLVCSELASFNIELNTAPHMLNGNALSAMEDELAALWSKCRKTALEMDSDMMMIGILPTLKTRHLVPENMSNMKRYRALNDQVMSLRNGKPFVIDIHGEEGLTITHSDVMLEAATTAFQIQFQVDVRRSAAFYNAALVLSAATVAVSANSPFMFGRDLWAETRIPVFEQSLAEYPSVQTGYCGPNRVTFGA